MAEPRLDEPNTFVSFSSFLRRLVQTFRLHNFEADLKSSAVLRMARDKLNATMIIRWNQHTRSQALLQPNLTHFADWIDSYAEACEDISPQRNQRTRVNSSSRRGPPDVSCQLCSQNHNLGRCPEYLEKTVYDRQCCVRRFNLCPNCLRGHEKGLCQSKTRCLVDRCNGFHHSTLHRTDARQMQQYAQPNGNWNQNSQNNFRPQTNQNQSNYGRKFNNENQRQQTSSNYNQQSGTQNRHGGSNSSTSHRGNWNKNGFHPQPMNTQNDNNNRQQSSNQRTVAQQQATTPQQNYTCSNQQETSWIRPKIQLQAIPVTLFNRDLCIETYALLDSGSDNTQITQKVADALQVQQPKDITLPLASLHGEHSVKTADVMIGIGALYSSCPVIRIPVYATAMDEFRMPRVQIEMLNEICRDHSHLQSIRFPTIRDNRIGILIGADAFTATVPRQFTTGPTGTPYGVNTLLGWTLTGPIPQRYTQKRVGQSNSTNITLFNHIKRRQDDPDEDLLQLFWTIEGVNFNQCSSKGQSSDDKEAVSILNDTIRHIGDRYQIGILWKKDITLPNNYFMAKVQWHALQQRLERDTSLRDRCEKTIKKDLDKNYITTADPSCRHSVWYLPHHPVINKQKPDKIRRVTNAASKYKGLSLNDALLTGQDLLCNLHGLLLRFRQYSVAITADIEAMFMQIGIQPKDQDYLRFLWTEDGNEKIFKYNRLIFGATCSPSCAIFVLQKCANDHKQEHPEAYTSFMQQFYMDDFMQSYPSEEEARRSAEEIKTVLQTGGFNLTKFLSNRPAALENLLEEDKAEMKAQRILGQTWDPKTDKLMFAKPKFLYTGQQMTQRKVLSMAASLFDPIGLISPFAIRFRCSLQRIIKEGRNWDQPVSECYQQELQEWMDKFDNMTPIEIPRCLIPSTNGTNQLHTFTDASMSAIAAIVYVRTTNADGSSTSRYVISKTKSGTDQAVEHSKTGVGSCNTWSRASWVL